MDLDLANLTKIFPGNFRALEDLRLSIASGEQVVLVGPSACGKTTLLRLIAGLETPNAGTIQIAGRTVNADPPWHRPVGMVFQRPVFVSGQTVREAVAGVGRGFFSTARGNFAANADRWLGRFGLACSASRRMEELSGGQAQRVALARLMTRGSAIQLLDEPLGQLDTVLRAELRQTLREEFARQRSTVVWVTHDPEDAWEIADRIAVMAQGKFLQVGTPEEILRHPTCRGVVELFQEQWGGMNFLDGTLQGGCLVTAFGAWPLPRRSELPLEKAGISVGLPVNALALPYNGPNREAVPLSMVVEQRRITPSGIRLLCRNDHGRLWATGSTENYPGEMVTLMIDLERALWFDARDGKVLAA